VYQRECGTLRGDSEASPLGEEYGRHHGGCVGYDKPSSVFRPPAVSSLGIALCVPGGRAGLARVSAATRAAVVLTTLRVELHSHPRLRLIPRRSDYRRVWLATLSVFGGIAIISLLFKLEFARGYLAIALPAGLLLLFLSRWVARKVIVRARKSFGRCITRLLVVGSPRAVRDLTIALSREPWSGYDVVGACIPGPTSRTEIAIPGFGSIPVLGDESAVSRAVIATGSNAVAVAATEQFHGKGLRDLSWDLEQFDIDLMVAPGVIDVVGPRLHMRPVAGLPLIHIEKPQYHGAKQFQKRAFDIGFAGLALLFGLPILLLIGLAVMLTSRGPVFYRQERIGMTPPSPMSV